ncbi:MAG: chorismate mutase [Spirochaetales bacterium]|nr:chorismate mutase [Spirochaetales bacterium]
MIKAVRGATGVAKNRAEHIKKNVNSLIAQLVDENNIEERDIVSILFSQTKDLTAYNPAAALRSSGFANVPLFCTQEPYVRGGLKRVVRVLITFNSESQEGVKPIYINGAEVLRPDLVCTRC